MEWFLRMISGDASGRFFRRDRAEAERIHDRERTRVHGEDVAQDAADSGGRALEWLDVGRVIVRLDLEGAAPSVANVDDAGVFAGTLNDALALGRQALQVDARRLVGAVLAPHDAVDAKLGEAWDAAEGGEDRLVFVSGDAVLRQQLRGDLSGRGGRKSESGSRPATLNS